jgi:hypothetical protein
MANYRVSTNTNNDNNNNINDNNNKLWEELMNYFPSAQAVTFQEAERIGCLSADCINYTEISL